MSEAPAAEAPEVEPRPGVTVLTSETLEQYIDDQMPATVDPEEAAAEDLQKPFHKNMQNFSQLSMDPLKVLFQAFHGQLWAEQLARRLRLQQARQLVYFALGVDPGDSLPERTPCTLAQVCYTRYLDLGEPLQTLEFEEDNSLDWTTKVEYFLFFLVILSNSNS